MKVFSVLGVILVALCLFACNSNKENEHQPLTIKNYAEVSLGDTTNLIITGGSGNIVVEGNDNVGISTTQNEKQRISLIGKELGTTNIFVRDKITNESCSIEVNVILPFLTLNFEEEEGIRPNSLFVLVASEIFSSSAISLFIYPLTTSAKTSCSRCESNARGELPSDGWPQ